MGTNTVSFDGAAGVWLLAGEVGATKASAGPGAAGVVWLVLAPVGLIVGEPEVVGAFAGVTWLIAATIAGTVAAAAASIAVLRKATR